MAAAESQCLEDNARKPRAAGVSAMDRRNAFSADSHERLTRWSIMPVMSVPARAR